MGQIESKALQHLEQLCVEIGPRRSVRGENQLAADYSSSASQLAGWQWRCKSIPCPLWEDRGTRLEVDGKAVSAGG